MKKEYMRPELTVLSLVVEDNTNVAPVKSITFTPELKCDDNVLSVAGNGLDFSLISSKLFG